jgi:Maltose acetyltransferase
MATFTGQKAKMLAGELYMANEPELAADHLRAQALLAKFNATAADADEERRVLLKQLLGRIGEGTVLKPTFRCDYGYNIAIGERTFINYDCVLLALSPRTMILTFLPKRRRMAGTIFWSASRVPSLAWRLQSRNLASSGMLPQKQYNGR